MTTAASRSARAPRPDCPGRLTTEPQRTADPGVGDESETRRRRGDKSETRRRRRLLSGSSNPGRPVPPCLLSRPPLRHNSQYKNRPSAAEDLSVQQQDYPVQQPHHSAAAPPLALCSHLPLHPSTQTTCKLLAGRPALWARRVSGGCPQACVE